MYLNKAMVYGNLTRDPEMKALPSGMQVCSFSLATNRVYNDRDGKRQEAVDYHNIVVFGKTAENVGKYMTKGSSIFVEGRMQTRSWEKDGVKQYRTEVIADRVQFGPKGSGAPSTSASGAAADTGSQDKGASVLPDYPEEEINPEDIPF
ncbi:single-stranded DNA-binding protein [Candidatus Kaiserbacteria bacterium RIFCSPLOWO2_02_FULL_45_11b]|uniref:Single-stranded DNA-binding protein n=1 Tax=Candidatus Kaiserbacteria bacterium RIFCSPLOWO2_12_FULL_45_26 TaxID=1798525 RepID=A0A1F6FF76_9BACT|nr:MAG: single-stranded DNA-binding protein [Candidatus Kaiserbacteria bacterium RIFCSPHIGHO2_12_45_16]OGG70240.1 MAG: single-stranded DNA-binding protein [Candidatus Kaiserbacteria bacterium RIFCSPLOWO2_01_FULL_45_25]OGG81907.1 MAG: single-stranded DNA-binding protein [Candidatus Kaiserbacteria bacterium RIFCSPLOWO2_02_FULL_45_11b]OGG84503.1 MAG: single-stranded DNA-binding protein [Candidatus Kaiserbacteria bacterium RIFCSPLOWO2_12_FULL_45_26]